MPKVSVLMPIFKTKESYLREAVESILNQTFDDFEAILVNDGSTDNSLQIIQAYADKDKRFKVINQENLGVIAARNNAIAQAKGTYSH